MTCSLLVRAQQKKRGWVKYIYFFFFQHLTKVQHLELFELKYLELIQN